MITRKIIPSFPDKGKSKKRDDEIKQMMAYARNMISPEKFRSGTVPAAFLAKENILRHII